VALGGRHLLDGFENIPHDLAFANDFPELVLDSTALAQTAVFPWTTW